MHISEGVLSAPVLISGAILAIGGIATGLRKLDVNDIPLCGVMAAVFFVASLIHVPVGFGSAHLLLTGLIGIFLGWAAFPAIFTALALQALLFQYGGITTLGVNTATMGFSAVCAWFIFHLVCKKQPGKIALAGFFAGSLGICLSALLTACALGFTNEGLLAAAMAILLAHLPIMLAEGLITMFTAAFLYRIRPQLLGFNIKRSMA